MHQNEARQHEEEIDEQLEALERVRRRRQKRLEVILEMVEYDAARREEAIRVQRPVAMSRRCGFRRHPPLGAAGTNSRQNACGQSRRMKVRSITA